jgi:DNA-binding transcriptional regulator YiaG/DNA-binding transcriptional ArsR family regulator
MGNMELASQQILRAVRGNRSQRAFARRLGYRGNPLTDWEHGRRYPTAAEALRAMQLAHIDVAEAFGRFHPAVPPPTEGALFDLGGWLARLNPSLSVTELSKRVGHSRSSVSRWLSGSAQPRLPEFLELVDAATGRAPDLVAELVPIDKVPALQGRHQASLAAKRIAFDAPWSEAVLRVLETLARGKRSEPDVDAVVARLGLPREHAERCLELLERAHLVTRHGDRYDGVRELTVDTRGGSDALLATKAHWAHIAAERAREPGSHDLFAYNVFAASEADFERIRAQLRTLFRETRSIIAASSPSQRVALMNLQLVAFGP